MFNICKAVYKKNRLISIRAYPWSFIMARISGGIFGILLPVLLYYIVFKRNLAEDFINYPLKLNYITYIITGEMLSILSFSTLMNVGRCLISEIREGTLDTFLLSPASRMGYYIGAYIEQIGRSIMECIIILLVGIIMGARFKLENIPLMCLTLLLSSLAFFSVAILISTIMVFTRDTYLVQNTFYLIMHCICGVIFPLEYFPEIVQVVSSFFPLTPAIELFRYCTIGIYDIQKIIYLILHIFALSIIYLMIGFWGFKRIEKKLIEEVLA